jgi:translation initiation factor 3 subunit G
MSTARFGRKWADVDEDDEAEDAVSPSGKATNAFETPVDENGIKTRIEYIERDGKTYKVTKRIRARTVQTWINANMVTRQTMEKFGKPKADPASEKAHIVRSEEEVSIEVTKTPALVIAKDDAEDKFHEDSLKLTEEMTKVKKVWTEMNRERQVERDASGVERVGEEGKTEGGDKPADAAAAGAAGQPGKYVPPSLRTDKGKGGGKGGDLAQQQEASLRITNLSEDCREGDLQDLFGQFGRLARVYLAKDQTTNASRGFAFVTYYSRADAEKAIQKLNGHGYDNLIMQVQFAKPRQ